MHQKPLRVVIGAGPYNNNPDWIQTQASQLNLLNRRDWERSFGPSSISAILAEHVWEHLSYEQGLRAAEICFDFLEAGGYIRCAVPDGFFPDEAYQRDAHVGGPGPQDHPAASHQFVFDYHAIATMLQTAGFTVNLLEYCDESGAFHANPWDEKQGLIYRSLRFDHRNRNGELGYTSLLVDGQAPSQPSHFVAVLPGTAGPLHNSEGDKRGAGRTFGEAATARFALVIIDSV